MIPRLADPSSYHTPVSPPRLEPRASADLALRHFTSIPNFHAAYNAGTLNPLQVIESLLPLIRRDVREPTAHATAFVQVRPDLVREAAEASTARWKAGKPLGLLDGVPIAVKDELDIEGYETKLGSKLAFKTRGISWCLKKLVEAGAILIGKATMHELGTGKSESRGPGRIELIAMRYRHNEQQSQRRDAIESVQQHLLLRRFFWWKRVRHQRRPCTLGHWRGCRGKVRGSPSDQFSAWPG